MNMNQPTNRRPGGADVRRGGPEDDRFDWQGKHYYLQEAQGEAGDWSSWGIYLCDQQGLPVKKLEFATPLGATAFANPSVSNVRLPETSKNVMVFSAFIHSHKTDPKEAGQFLMVLPR